MFVFNKATGGVGNESDDLLKSLPTLRFLYFYAPFSVGIPLTLRTGRDCKGHPMEEFFSLQDDS